MINKIKKNISLYLGFNVDELLTAGDYVTIFGGAVRDSIANMKIHDVDVMVLPNSMTQCINLIIDKGFIFDESAFTKDFHKIYDIKYIFEPKTFIKIRNNEVIRIQFIRPNANIYSIVTSKKSKLNDFNTISKSFEILLNNVDLSCCGVSISSSGFKEHIKHAKNHCLCKIYRSNTNALMKTDRFISRVEKLKSRGWTDIEFINKYKLNKLNNLIKQDNQHKRILKIKKNFKN